MEEQVIYRQLHHTLPATLHAPAVALRIPWTTSKGAVKEVTWHNMPGDCNQPRGASEFKF
eukprot:738558-Amphidinium_carterae.1